MLQGFLSFSFMSVVCYHMLSVTILSWRFSGTCTEGKDNRMLFFLSQEMQANETTKERKKNPKRREEKRKKEKSEEINNKSFENDTFLRIRVPFAFILFIILKFKKLENIFPHTKKSPENYFNFSPHFQFSPPRHESIQQSRHDSNFFGPHLN